MAGSARKRWARRRRERGATVMVVVLVSAMLMGIGLFAARSASVAVQQSGYDRQMTQTHYFTDYAMLATITELSSGNADAHIHQAETTPDSTCAVVPSVLNYTCERFTLSSLQTISGQTFLNPWVSGTPPTPGSLGIADLDADFNVEMTDIGPAPNPVAGSDLTTPGGAKLSYKSATLTATGLVRPNPGVGNPLTTVSATSASIESQRAHLVVGPMR